MEIINELEKLNSELSNLKKDLNEQLNAIDNDLSEFHKILIELSSKYPEQKELLEFIVFINDRIETTQQNTKEILNESLNEAIEIERQFIKNQIENRKEINIIKEKSLQISVPKVNLKELKWVIGGLAVIIFLGILYFAPDTVIKLFDQIIKYVKG